MEKRDEKYPPEVRLLVWTLALMFCISCWIYVAKGLIKVLGL